MSSVTSSSLNVHGVFEPFHISRAPWEEHCKGERLDYWGGVDVEHRP